MSTRRLRACRWGLLVGLTACADPAPARRVVVLGMDGLERSYVESEVAAGRLPRFRQLLDEGAVTDLSPTHPMLSPILWTTMASGYPGEVHGVGGWTSAKGRPFTANDVRARRLWDVASAHDRPVLVAGWLMTWPASPVQGSLYTDKLVWALPMTKDPDDDSVALSRASHAAATGLAWPPAAQAAGLARVPAVSELTGHPLHAQVAAYGGPFHPWTRDETQLRHFEAGWGDGVALGLVYLVGADQVSHLYWPFTSERVHRLLRQQPDARMRAAAADRRPGSGRRAHPLADRPMTPQMWDEGAAQVPRIYGWLDEALGRVMDRIDPATTTLLVVSDHGFQEGRRDAALAGGHRDPAVLLAWGAGVRPGADAAEPSATVLDLAPTVAALLGLPGAQDWTGRVLRDVVEPPPEPVAPMATWRLDRAAVADDGPLDPADRQLLEQLEALGYVDEGGRPVLGASREQGAPKRPPKAPGETP
jgi:hypothetical protein